MALVSPGVEVTITDESQYLPSAPNSVPLVVIATAQNKSNPTGTGIATATTAANANKLFLVTSQRDLTTLYGNPFFYTTTNGTPIHGYELNEYGLLAAYSLLGVTNRCYVLRADVDLSTLTGRAGRPSGAPTNGTYWLDTTNTQWGIYEFNATTGQFTVKKPIVVTDDTDLLDGVPVATLGNMGDYAINAIEMASYMDVTSSSQYFFKDRTNTWVPVGSGDWMNSWPTVQGTRSNPTLVPGNITISLNGEFSATIAVTLLQTVNTVSSAINALGWTYLMAAVVNGKLNIYSRQTGGSSATPKYVEISGDASCLESIGFTTGRYYQPELVYGTSAQMPLWQSSQSKPRPTGSVWIKVGAAGNGLSPVLSQYQSNIGSWVSKAVRMATSDWAVTATMDPAGGQNISAGSIYAQYDYNTEYETGPIYLWERVAVGPTVVTGDVKNPTFNNGPYTAKIQVSIPGSNALSSEYTFSLDDATTEVDFVTAWSASGVPHTSASITTDGSIQIVHTEGGEIIVNDTDPNTGVSNGLMEDAGFVPNSTEGVKYGSSIYNTFIAVNAQNETGSGSGLQAKIQSSYKNYNVIPDVIPNPGTGYAVGNLVKFLASDLGGLTSDNDCHAIVTAVDGVGGVTGLTYVSGTPLPIYAVHLSNWRSFTYTANEGAPVRDPADRTNWFYSVVDQVDIMVNYDNNWRGYRNQAYDSNGFPKAGTNKTDPKGPIIAASEPTQQSDKTPLEYGDLWIDTSDLENYPTIYRWQSVNNQDMWVLLNNADQVNSTGVLFADARWATNDSTDAVNDPLPSIVNLLTSDYVDIDAPESSLSPAGMLLFNTRRSGYNIKQFRSNYFNGTDFPDMSLPEETGAWVTISGNTSDGSPYMGRKAQRALVVEALKACIDTNVEIRSEDNYFNLIACPNYIELQPNMIVLNADRGETAYIIGDTPLGLPDDATAIQAWATLSPDSKGDIATSTGEDGLGVRNTYMGLFYPSGLTTDLSGNPVVVPASHMMLRTFLKNDTIAYPWLAAAGTRRGIIDNASAIGYVNRVTGEFNAIKNRLGLRDTLYTNFINPLVYFTNNGLLNYGNKTSYDSQSALDRTNVARLIAYLRRQLTIAARPFVFEPNDAITRQQISAVIETMMVELVSKRGIYDYYVQCDESNNTPARIDRNELWVDVAIEPVKAAEFIYIPVRVLNTGAISAGRS